MSIELIVFWTFVSALVLSLLSGIEYVAGGEGFFTFLCGLSWLATVVLGLYLIWTKIA